VGERASNRRSFDLLLTKALSLATEMSILTTAYFNTDRAILQQKVCSSVTLYTVLLNISDRILQRISCKNLKFHL